MSELSEFYIQGPISVSYHTNDSKKKNIIIFGDRHVKIENEECKEYIRIDNFLKKLANEDPQNRYDLFIEGIETQVGDEEKNYLMNVINMNAPDNMKKYFLDIRKKYPEYIAFYNFTSICSGLANVTSISEGQASYNYDLLKDLTEGFIYNLQKLYTFLTEPTVVFKELIKPELDKIKKISIKNKIISLLKQGVEKYSIGTEEYINMIITDILSNMNHNQEEEEEEEEEEGEGEGKKPYLYFINTFLSEKKEAINKLYDDIAEYGQVFMDAYTLCLILNDEHKNCIVYAGEAHSRVLRQFLEDHSNLTKINQKFLNTSDKQCVKFPGDF
jgi:hypothetical protein